MANMYKRHQLMGMRTINPQPRPFELDLVDSLVHNGLGDIVRRRQLPCLIHSANGERLNTSGPQWPLEHDIQNGSADVTGSMANGAKIPTHGTKNGVVYGAAQYEVSAESEEPMRQQLDGQDLEWKLKDRPDSDDGPVSAPVDTGSQTNEGFKRFYKAVVSPTHVRVTAGGRIVPNPRGSSSPTGKPNNDKANGDALSLVLARPSSQASANKVVTTTGPPHQQQSPASAGFPGMMPPSMPMGGMPMMPFPFGYPMPPLPPGPMAPASMVPVQNPDKSGKNGDTKTDKGSVKSEQPARTAASVMHGPNPGSPFFAPPAQSFMPGMPMPMPMPMPMMASHPALPAFPVGAVPPMGPQMPFAPVFGPMQWQGQFPQHLPMHMPMPMPMPMPMHMPMPGVPYPGIGPLVNGPPFHAPTAPSPSSIVMSEVTRKHIENFRAQLKWIDNQLQFNKHQVDEGYMKHFADGIRTQLRAFERNLQSQLEHEAKQRSKTSNKDTSSTREVSKSVSAISEIEEVVDQKSTALVKTERRAKAALPQQKSSRSIMSTEASDKAEVSIPAQSLVAAPRNVINEPTKKKSGLPITAALAPPFQPRSQTNLLASHRPSHDSLKQPETHSNCLMLKSSEALMNVSVQASMDDHPPVAAKDSKRQVDLLSSIYKNLEPSNETLGLPYLEGKLRPGVSVRDAKDEDYIYHRQLTEDELRARHLYWGNAPRSVQKGLPKYDGKDFYPPSPTKENKYMDFVTTSKSQVPMGGGMMEYPYSTEPKTSHLPVRGLDDYGYLPATNHKMSRLPVGDFGDYDLKPLAEQNKSSRAVGGGNGDYGFTPTDPEDTVRTMKELLALSLSRHEQKAKRDTKSDNVNGNSFAVKERAGTRGRPATSLLSHELSDSDQTQATTDVAGTFRSPLYSAQSQSNQSDETEDSHEKILFRGRQNMRSSKRSGALRLGKKPSSGAFALPGAVSSTTAHGLLPQYAGSAAASLSPSVGNGSPSNSSARTSPPKVMEDGRHEVVSGGVLTGLRGENKPLYDDMGLNNRGRQN
ncbi:hypothetical protein ACHAQA_009134 [Verticillium albo-atrum]